LQNGVIEAVHVKEGEEVDRGDVLFTLVAVRGDSEGKMLEDTTQRLMRAQLKSLYDEVAQRQSLRLTLESETVFQQPARAPKVTSFP
jgi:multidrug resistance efflux pump